MQRVREAARPWRLALLRAHLDALCDQQRRGYIMFPEDVIQQLTRRDYASMWTKHTRTWSTWSTQNNSRFRNCCDSHIYIKYRQAAISLYNRPDLNRVIATFGAPESQDCDAVFRDLRRWMSRHLDRPKGARP
jgi:hypothetical protein